MGELADKVNAIIDQMRPYIEADGGTVALDRLDGSTVRIFMRGPDTGCASLLVLHKLAIERRLVTELTEVEAVEVSAGLPPVPVDQS